MALPPNLAHYLAGQGVILPGESDAPCEGARFHSPTPMRTYEVVLVPHEWGVPTRLRATLCANCRDNFILLMRVLQQAEGELEWSVRREFGNLIRALAMKGWQEYQAVLAADTAPTAS